MNPFFEEELVFQKLWNYSERWCVFDTTMQYLLTMKYMDRRTLLPQYVFIEKNKLTRFITHTVYSLILLYNTCSFWWFWFLWRISEREKRKYSGLIKSLAFHYNFRFDLTFIQGHQSGKCCLYSVLHPVLISFKRLSSLPFPLIFHKWLL